MEFWVKATWDSDSGVFVSESNIKGLHLEAETLREFQDEMLLIAPELIIDNHGDEEPEKTRARDMPITEAFGLMASNLYNVIYNMLRDGASISAGVVAQL